MSLTDEQSQRAEALGVAREALKDSQLFRTSVPGSPGESTVALITLAEWVVSGTPEATVEELDDEPVAWVAGGSLQGGRKVVLTLDDLSGGLSVGPFSFSVEKDEDPEAAEIRRFVEIVDDAEEGRIDIGEAQRLLLDWSLPGTFKTQRKVRKILGKYDEGTLDYDSAVEKIRSLRANCG